MVFASNGNVLLCYEAQLPEVYSLSESDFDELHSTWFQALKTLPPGTVVHKQDIYQNLGYKGSNLPNKSFLEKATRNYFIGRRYLAHRSYLYFLLPLDKTLKASKYVNPFKKSEKGLHRKMDLEVAEFVTAVNDVISFINNSRKLLLKPMRRENAL